MGSIVLLLLGALGAVSAVLSAPQGRVYHYEPGIFRMVAANRAAPMLWGQVDGFASTPDCSLVDTKRPWYILAQIYNPSARAWGAVRKYQILDCSDPKDRKLQQAHKLIFEVDAHSAALGGFAYPATPYGKTWGRIIGKGRLDP